MLECPHCHKPGIAAWAKLMASSASPAVCRVCHKPSSISVLTASILGLINYSAFSMSTITAFAYQSFLPLAAFAILYAATGWVVIKLVNLIPITDAQVSAARRFLLVFFVILVLALFLVFLRSRQLIL